MYKILKKAILHNTDYMLYELKFKLYHYRSGQAVMTPGERGFQDLSDNVHMKVVRLSDLRTGRLCLLGDIPGTDFC